jgi:hypothetical protein
VAHLAIGSVSKPRWHFDPRHLGHVFGSDHPPECITPSLWVRWPETWREHTKGLLPYLPLVCSMPGTWADAEGAFAPLAAQPLTREQFCVHGGAAYPFILNRPRWDSALPDSRAAASDIKRVALNLAFGEILDGYAFAEILMGDTRTFAEVLDHYAPARHSFEDFGHLVNWLHVVAKNRVRTVMRTLEQSQPAESRASEQALVVEVPRRGDNPLSRRRLRDVRLDGL